MTSILDKAGKKNGKSDFARPPAQPLKCPECTSQRVWKDGIRYTGHGDVQRYLCRSCGYRFSQPNVKVNIICKAGEVLYPVSQLTCKMVGSTSFSSKKSFDSLTFPSRKDVGSHEITSVEKRLNSFPHYNSDCQVCVNEEKMKNLVKVESRTEKRAAGATTQAEVKGKIVDFAWWMKKGGYAETTIVLYGFDKE